ESYLRTESWSVTQGYAPTLRKCIPALTSLFLIHRKTNWPLVPPGDPIIAVSFRNHRHLPVFVSPCYPLGLHRSNCARCYPACRARADDGTATLLRVSGRRAGSVCRRRMPPVWPPG